MRVAASGGTPSPLIMHDPSRLASMDVLPSFLPDGRHYLYKHISGSPDIRGTYVGSLDARPEENGAKLILAIGSGAAYASSGGSGPGQLLFMREGTLMAQPFDDGRLEVTGEAVPVAERVGADFSNGFFSVSNNGLLAYSEGAVNNRLTWFDRQGKALGRAGEPSSYTYVALSPDGSRAAVRRKNSQGPNIWLVDFTHERITRFTYGVDAGSPVWSPDGSQIIYAALRSDANSDLYRKPASGAKDAEVLLKSEEFKTPTSWSPDGRFLLYTVLDPKMREDLWILPLESHRKPIPFLRTEFAESNAQFSPKAPLIAYISNESGNDEIYVRPFLPDSNGTSFDIGARMLVSKGGGTAPRWRGDGKELFYAAPDGRVMSVEVTLGQTFQAETPKPLFQVSSMDRWDVTADGKRFLFLGQAEQQTQPPFTVIMNWQAELKK